MSVVVKEGQLCGHRCKIWSILVMIPKPVLFFIASLNLCCVPVTSGTVSRSLQRVGVNWPGEGFIVSFSFPRAETGKPQPNPSRNLFRCGPWAKNGFNVFQALYKKGFKRRKISIRGWQWHHELAVLRLREKQAGAKGVSACLFPGARPNFFRSSRELTYFQKHSMLAEKPFAFLSNRTNHWFANEPKWSELRRTLNLSIVSRSRKVPAHQQILQTKNWVGAWQTQSSLEPRQVIPAWIDQRKGVMGTPGTKVKLSHPKTLKE